MNTNNAFGDYIRGNKFRPKPLVTTKSPSLDVSFPLNYERLASFYEEAPAIMRNIVYPASISDDVTMQTMEQIYKKYGVYVDSNTAVAFASAQEIDGEYKLRGHAHTVVLATGHPAREANLAVDIIGESIKVPESIQALQKRCDPIAIIQPQLDAVESAIASCF